MLADAAILEGLTDAQRQAVLHLDGPLLVLAGPGSGKTTVVTRRIAHLMACGIPAWQILALTFTNKAAGEMRQRIERLVPEQVQGRDGLTVCTFHSFCARLLRRYAAHAGLSERFTIYDSADQRDAVKRALAAADMNSRNWAPASIQHAISHAKNSLLSAQDFAAQAFDFNTRSIARVYDAYQRILQTNDALDFDDLLLITARLLKENQTVREELQQRFQYLLIDEYQDTNRAQFLIAHSLAFQHRNICVVGDPDQSIYGWRGADIQNILDFETHYPNAVVIPLGQNFRSRGYIVAAAAGLIERNRRRKHKRLFTKLAIGLKPVVYAVVDERAEAELIADEFRRLHEEGGEGGDESVPYREMAVLYRINSLSRVLEDAFSTRSIPYVLARGTAFYERKEVKDAVAYLRLLANPSDEVALRRIINEPARGISKTTLDKIELLAINEQIPFCNALRRVHRMSDLAPRAVASVRKFTAMFDEWETSVNSQQLPGQLLGDSLAVLVERVLRESGLEAMYRNSRLEEDEERYENLNELVSAAASFSFAKDDDREPTLGNLLAAFLESIALVSDADVIDPAKGAVTLMSLHAAKGLEFDVVAIAGLEEGLLPHRRAAESDAELEEERRLCFVGMTRARKRLLMTRAVVRSHRGLRERTIESSFLRELPESSIEFQDFAGLHDTPWGSEDNGESVSESHRGQAPGGIRYVREDEAAVYPVGSRVCHPTFGIGVVEAYTPRAAGAAARIAFKSHGVKTLLLEFAKLQRVD